MNATYTRERHAAHTGNGTGWDLERWDVLGVPTQSQMLRALATAAGVPSDAEYHCGGLDRDGRQHWYYVRRAPLSAGTCVHCI